MTDTLARRGYRRVRFFSFVLLLVTAHVVLAQCAHTAEQLCFFRASEDAETSQQNPGKYERLALPQHLGNGVVFVDRAPALCIALAGVQSVIVERKNVAHSLDEVVNEMLKTADQEKTPKEGGGSEYYDATFFLTEAAASQLRDLMTRSKGQILLLTIGGHRFGAGRVMGPLEGNGFAPDLFEKDRADLQRTLSPIRDKVTWK